MSGGGIVFRAHIREHRDVCAADADHGDSVAAGELFGDVRGDLHVPVGVGAECLDSPESKDGSGGEGRVVSGANVEPDMKLDVGLDMDNQD